MNFETKDTQMEMTPFTATFYKNKCGWAFDVQIDGRLFSKNPMMEAETKEQAKEALNIWCKSHGKSVIIL